MNKIDFGKLFDNKDWKVLCKMAKYWADKISNSKQKKLRRRGLWELCPKWKHTCHVCLQIGKGNRYDTKRPRGFARSSEQINVKKQELGETSERAKRKASS